MSDLNNVVLIFENPNFPAVSRFGNFAKRTVTGTFEYFERERLFEILFRNESLILKSYSGISRYMPIYYALIGTTPEIPLDMICNYWRLKNE